MNVESTDPVQPQYYLDRGAFALEAEMRADYAVVRNARKIAARVQFDSHRAELLAAADRIARRWASPAGVTGPWEQLDNAVSRWERTPQLMHRLHDQVTEGGREPGMLPIDWRTCQQARELTGNGTWPPTTLLRHRIERNR
ncbi:hypothetical protein FOH10_29505 [Nocardia otitidiscaviarum]|uniref:Uncharacterized protein n=1 Tax=Nocardia otitidiscaviarum TaxID=1823 RepID=A0A516NTM0_9NOCA|nr:hypothetical protein [Nocardia otitidiscaviarum]MCP9621590.1 hypothetical protein [Nocardia otitidiscaviarum]QDP82256.1 hypothetical protein FOH10_29505 [Nocardia otitidiscaviarum]